MKKFLLLLVGVLFTLSANAWTLYVDIKDTGWTSAPYIYCGKLSDTSDYNSNATFFNKYQLSLVYGTIYKWEGPWDNLSIIFFSKEDLGNPSPKNDNDYNKSTYSTKWNGTDAYGAITTNSGGNWTLVDKRLYVLYKGGTNGIASVKDNYTPPTLYSLRGDFTSTGGSYTWENNDYTFTPQEDGKTYIYDLSSIGELKDGQTFKIYNITKSTWYGQGAATISKDSPYTLGTGGDIKVNGAISNPLFTLVVEGDSPTLTITEKPSTDVYTYKYSGGDNSWGYIDLNSADGKFSITRTFTKNTEFGIRQFKNGTENAWWWGNDASTNTSISELGKAYGAVIQNNSNGKNWIFGLETGEYTLTFDPEAKTITFTSSSTPEPTYSYRFHSNMVNGTWPADDNNDPAWKMTEQDGVWIWQGTLAASGAFGFKRLGKDEAPSKNNTWFYCSSSSDYAITLNNWSGAQEKDNNNDTGHDWTFSPNGGTYQVIFDPAHLQTKIVAVDIDYSKRTYVISGTFNGWIAPADNKVNCQFKYQETGDYAGNYVWKYTGLMKNLEFKISDLSNLTEDSDKKWGKAYGYNYTAEGNVAKLTASTPGTPSTPYQLRRTNVPGEDVPVTNDELYNPTFILDPATMTLTVINNPVTTQYKYGVHSNFANPTDPNKWSCVEMEEHDDGSWSYTVAIPNGCRFGIRQAEKGKDITDKNNQTAWVSSLETTNTTVNNEACVTALVATKHDTKKDGLNWATDNDAFNGTTVYTIVFTPAKKADGTLETNGTGTLVIYNNDAVTATIQPAKDGDDYLIVDGQKANEIVVTVPVASYLGTSEGEFSLSMGGNTIATAPADTYGKVTFEYLPYLSGTREFTLSGASKSVALNVVSPTLGSDYFSFPKDPSITLIDNLTGYADAAVALEPTATLIYDIPALYYTINGYTYEAEQVYWSTNGFSFIIKNMVAFDTDSYFPTEEAAADCYVTPIFPFVVREKASTFAVDASNLTIQQFGGSKVEFCVVVDAGADVSGVEGVAVENEDAPVEYYNLQGQRVNGELAPGIYIRRQGTTVTKVRF